MTEQDQDRTRRLRRLAWLGAGLTFGLIVLGGVVRITGSGMGCGDHWPRCDGEWFPPLDLPTLIESSHRWVAVLVSLSIAALAVAALRRHRGERELLVPALAIPALLVVQILLGAVTVWLVLPPWVVITHLANALLILALLVVLGMRARPGGLPPRPTRRHSAHGLVHAAAGVGLLVILWGGQVANFNAGWVCQGFPLCEGAGLLPPAVRLGPMHWTHRVLAFGFLALMIAVAVRVRRRAPGSPLARATTAALALTAVQIAVAAAMVTHALPGSLRALHMLVGTAIWVALVVMVVWSARTGEGSAGSGRDDAAEAPGFTDDAPEADRVAAAADGAAARPGPGVFRDLVTLTKPRIIALLLVTTVAPMFMTDRGMPSLELVAWVVLGGYLMAGGANAINMWFDRDIDRRMGRTRLRPIPSGRISPLAGLAFGLALGAAAFVVFWTRVNPLSAWLALGGLLFYVLVYTMWLKRSTTQNIVIGGAAGAFPPLVGWAAVAGELDLAAIYLFAIIFYWTPPHFWALALVKQGDYARAGVPMMPVVRGERRTKVEMLIYTLILLPLTLLPLAFSGLGPVYGAAAALLGARLLWYCVQLLREHGTSPTAWRMYRYSLVYLALLFVAMGIDRTIPYGHAQRPMDPSEVIILSRPDSTPALPAAEPAEAAHHEHHAE